ncbi:DUF6412 domain-containing protein [Micromonospora sp. NPDC049679]|uniref:DUF6412 domain-containing protein n=1 Tax=Micromonospora sp. NPDC049679 TaxID=3155920 RepID=UPI0033DCA52E
MPGFLTSVAGVWAYAYAQIAAVPSHPAELLAVAATLLAVAVTLRLVARLRLPADDPARQGTTMRERARRAGVPRQLDPDAAGRPRPRAPTAPFRAVAT